MRGFVPLTPGSPGAPRGRLERRRRANQTPSATFSGVKRVRFAPSPTGSLHVGNALTAVVNRRFGDWLLLRVDDTDATRTAAGSEAAILRDLEWLGVTWDDGPVRQSDRVGRYREAAEELVRRRAAAEAEGAVRAADGLRPVLLRADGRPTYHLASVVDDLDFEITHVIRGKDHLPNRDTHERLSLALAGRAPQYVHHGLIVGDDGAKLSKREPLSSLADLRAAGFPAAALRAYLEELGLPRGDVRYDVSRIRRLATDAIAAMPDEELAERLGVPATVVPAARGARDLDEARQFAEAVVTPPEPVSVGSPETLERFRELRETANGGVDEAAAREIVRELKAVGGDLRALRLALTGRDRGPELWAVIAALPRDEALRRIDAAL